MDHRSSSISSSIGGHYTKRQKSYAAELGSSSFEVHCTDREESEVTPQRSSRRSRFLLFVLLNVFF
jgi:hypothetical protein